MPLAAMPLQVSSVVILAMSVCLSTAACRRAPETRAFPLRGQVLAVTPGTRALLVKHDDIPGFMPAMTMTYAVKDARLLDGLAPGDLVTATLVVGDDRAWLSAVERTGTAPLPADAPSRVPVAAGIDVLEVGDTVPDTPLRGQDGATWTLSAWRGSAGAITFIYTRCPLPEFCPLMDRRFAEVQALAAADPTLRGRVRLLSISFDPDRDTPARLAAHAQALGADPAVWRFATADAATVDGLAARFAVNVIRESDGTITHNLRTAVVDAAGRVTAIFDGNAWTAAELSDALRRAGRP